MATVRGPVEGCCSVRLTLVRVRALVQEPADGVGVLAFGRVDERGIHRAGRRAGDERQRECHDDETTMMTWPYAHGGSSR